MAVVTGGGSEGVGGGEVRYSFSLRTRPARIGGSVGEEFELVEAAEDEESDRAVLRRPRMLTAAFAVAERKFYRICETIECMLETTRTLWLFCFPTPLQCTRS